MPSSMIFTGLVVLWLIVLVPAVARHRQEVSRPSAAALSSRVLTRPQRRASVEVENVHERDTGVLDDATDAPIPAARDGRSPATDDVRPGETLNGDDDAELDAAAYDDAESYDAEPYDDDRGWERPPPRYRPGRGGFDAEAAALTARARYAFRQRVVLALLIGAIAAAVAAIAVTPLLWGLHGALDAALVGYLAYLRRQVRMEEQIRARRAARLAGTRHAPAAEDPELDDWAERGRAAAQPDPVAEDDEIDDADGDDADEFDEEPERVSGTGEPVGLLRVHAADVDKPALPRLEPAPPPPLPAGTALVEADDADLAVAEIELPHRRAVGE